MSSAPVTNVQSLYVVIMDLDKMTADTVKTLESFAVSVKTHQFEYIDEFQANTFFERGQGKKNNFTD